MRMTLPVPFTGPRPERSNGAETRGGKAMGPSSDEKKGLQEKRPPY